MFVFLNKPWFRGVLIWIAIAILAVYIRMYPLWSHMWAPTHEVATMAVISKIKETFMLQLHAQNPQMSIEQAGMLATNKLNETLHNDKEHVTWAIEQANENLFKQSNLPDKVYLLESDPYYYYHLTENILTKGKMADLVKGHQYFDTLMTAPFGYWQPLSMHPYIGAFIYQAARKLNLPVDLMSGIALTPVVLSVIFLAAFLWCGRQMPLSWPSCGIACFYFAMLPVVLRRTSLGWYDTDPYILFFTLTWLGIMFRSAALSTKKTAAFLGLMQAANLILFSLIWQGWVFLFFMTLIASFLLGVYSMFIQKDKHQALGQIILAGSFLIALAITGIAIYGFSGFFTFFTEGGNELGKFTNKGISLWPNLFLEVGELERSTLAGVLRDLGGKLFLILSALGSIIAVWQIIRSPKSKINLHYILLLAFLLITTVLTIKANRFTLFMIVPLSFFFALTLEAAAKTVNQLPYPRTIMIACMVGLTGWNWVEANGNVRQALTPIFNDAWNDNLSALRTLTPPDAIINSWWPPGHFIKAIAHRRVMFDGASIGENQTGYWMARALLSTDENEAKGLLRMLNLSGNKAVEFLLSNNMKVSDAVDVITAIAPLSKQEAAVKLHGILNADDTRHLLELTHGKMPHSYLMIYNEIVDQNIGIVFVGRRNFRKIEQINADPRQLALVPKEGSRDFIEYLWGLAGGASHFSESYPLVNEDADGYLFSAGLRVSRDMKEAVMHSGTYGNGSLKSIVYLKNGKVVEEKNPNATLGYSALLYTVDGRLMCRMMDTYLANALMIKLYFFNGQGAEHFKLIKSSTDLTGRTQIKTFQVQ